MKARLDRPRAGVACKAGRLARLPWRAAWVLAHVVALLAAPLPASAAPLVITVQGEDGAALADAVVAVFVEGTPPSARAPQPAQMSQRDKRFIPGVLAVQSGTPVSFPNFDTVRHHVYSFSPIKTFEIKLYVGTPNAPVVFDKPGTAVLGCNIHDQMAAFVRVVDTPHFALTDASGQARLDVPGGSHRVQVWHASLPVDADAPLQPLEVTGESAAMTLSIRPR